MDTGQKASVLVLTLIQVFDHLWERSTAYLCGYSGFSLYLVLLVGPFAWVTIGLMTNFVLTSMSCAKVLAGGLRGDEVQPYVRVFERTCNCSVQPWYSLPAAPSSLP